MSLTKSRGLVIVAQSVCRELRRRATNAEKIFWNAVRDRQLMGRKFYRQHPLFYDQLGKETFYVADFYCHEALLVVEIDGHIHDRQVKKDVLREEVIRDLGLRVIRFRNHEVEGNLGGVLRRLEKTLAERSRELHTPSLSKRRGRGMSLDNKTNV